MSNELIRKTDVLDLLNEFYAYFEDYEVYRILSDGIDNMNPANAVEQKQGHWIEKDDYDGEVYYTCSVCNEPWFIIEGTPQENRMKYCPNCGAKMDGEVK